MPIEIRMQSRGRRRNEQHEEEEEENEAFFLLIFASSSFWFTFSLFMVSNRCEEGVKRTRARRRF
jgi:hypothetical protein